MIRQAESAAAMAMTAGRVISLTKLVAAVPAGLRIACCSGTVSLGNSCPHQLFSAKTCNAVVAQLRNSTNKVKIMA